MAQAFHGRGGAFEIGTTPVGSVVEIEQTAENEDVDTTAMGDTVRTYLAGLPGGGGSVRMRWDLDASGTPNAGQVAIEAGAAAGTPVTLTWYPTGKTAGKSKYSGSVVIQSAAVRGSVDNLVEYDVSWRGVLVRSTYTT